MFTRLFWFPKWNKCSTSYFHSSVCRSASTCVQTQAWIISNKEASPLCIIVQQNILELLIWFPYCYYNHQSKLGLIYMSFFSYTNAEVAIWKGSTRWCKKLSCRVEQWEGESVNLCKIIIVLYLQNVVLNLYILANKLQII